MAERSAPPPRLLAPLAGLLSAAIPAAATFGFTIDDALVIARYAANLAAGHGARFYPGGPVTDGVTPLGYAHLLAPFAAEGPLAALEASRWIGLVTWLLAAAALGGGVARVPGSVARHGALLLVLCSLHLGAWSSAGMETGLVMALGTLAALDGGRRGPLLGTGAAGVAAALRPELLPFALVLAVGRAETSLRAGAPPAARLLRAARFVALVVLPFVIVALVRLRIFGHPAPLAWFAKPSDLRHGLLYATSCFLLAGPLAVAAPWALRALSPWPRWLVLAVMVHLGALVAAGGDWMPFARLLVPALPAVVLATAHLLGAAPLARAAPTVALALAGQLVLFAVKGPAVRSVLEARRALIDELGGALAGASRVATVDAGWVSAATDARVLDLAGVTDPEIARLPGGHTTKRITPEALERRAPDALVLLVAPAAQLQGAWTSWPFARGVERSIASFPEMERRFSVAAVSRGPLRYVVLRRRIGPEGGGAEGPG